MIGRFLCIQSICRNAIPCAVRCWRKIYVYLCFELAEIELKQKPDWKWAALYANLCAYLYIRMEKHLSISHFVTFMRGIEPKTNHSQHLVGWDKRNQMRGHPTHRSLREPAGHAVGHIRAKTVIQIKFALESERKTSAELGSGARTNAGEYLLQEVDCIYTFNLNARESSESIFTVAEDFVFFFLLSFSCE